MLPAYDERRNEKTYDDDPSAYVENKKCVHGYKVLDFLSHKNDAAYDAAVAMSAIIISVND